MFSPIIRRRRHLVARRCSPALSAAVVSLMRGRQAPLPTCLLNLASKHISPVKAIWLDLEKGIRKQHKAKQL